MQPEVQGLQGEPPLGAVSRPPPALPTRWRDTMELWLYGLMNARLILLLTPRVVERSLRRVSVRVPLTYRSRNHFGSMQFGSLMVGAELGPGILAIKLAAERGLRVVFVMRHFEAELLHRSHGAVTFVCEDRGSIEDAIGAAQAKGGWEVAPVEIDAWSDDGDSGVIAHFHADLAIRVV